MGYVFSKLCAGLPSAIWVGVVDLIASFGPGAFSSLSDESRITMVDSLRRMLRFSQSGFDVGWEYSVSSPSIRAAIATLALANIFKPWAAVGWVGKTAEELTEMSGSGAEVELISKSPPPPRSFSNLISVRRRNLATSNSDRHNRTAS